MRIGFRQTEVGQIPEDWSVEQLGNCLVSRPSYGINAAAVPYSDRLPTYIRITDISEEGRFSPAPRVSVRSTFAQAYLLSDGDIVFARTGASVGKSYRYTPTDGALVYAGFLIRVRPDPAKLVPDLVAAYATSGTYWRWVQLMSMRSGQPGINGKEYAQLPVPVPPLFEQRNIVKVLGDVKALLAGLDRLIAKKRDLKLAAMQQLLTGRTRLPGFQGEWDATSLGEVADVKTGPFGSLLHESDYVSDGTPIITVEHLGEFGVEHVNLPMVSESDCRRLQAYALEAGDIVFSRVGAVDRNALIREAEAGWLFSGRLLRVRPDKRRVHSAFLSYQFHGEPFKVLVRTVAVGQTMASLNTAILKSITVDLPSLQEQVAIANALSDMNAELTALEARRDKTRALKQGMVQELLTGRTRLV